MTSAALAPADAPAGTGLPVPGLARSTALLLGRSLRATLRQPVWVIGGLATPLLYLALFAPLLSSLRPALVTVPGFASGSIIDGFLPGMLILFAFGAGTGAGWIAIAELQSGVTERFRVTPVPRFAILAGTALNDAIMCLAACVVVIAVAIPFGFHVHFAGAAVTLVMAAMLTAAVSAAACGLGLRLGQIGSLAAVVTSVQLPVTLLSGVLLPLSLGPPWLRALAHANPLYYAADAARAACSGTIGQAAVVGLAVTTVALPLALTWATRVYQRAIS
jgi:ABC-2 type transport system permease protein